LQIRGRFGRGSEAATAPEIQGARSGKRLDPDRRRTMEIFENERWYSGDIPPKIDYQYAALLWPWRFRRGLLGEVVQVWGG